MNEQEVYISKTASGVPGLFAGRYLAVNMAGREQLLADRLALEEYCRRMGFKLVDRPND